DPVELVGTGAHQDHALVGRAPLHRQQPRHRGLVERIAAQAPHALGRIRDHPAAAQHGHRLGDAGARTPHAQGVGAADFAAVFFVAFRAVFFAAFFSVFPVALFPVFFVAAFLTAGFFPTRFARAILVAP